MRKSNTSPEQPMLRLSVPTCPKCGDSDIGTEEVLTGTIRINTLHDDGTIDDYGQTQLDWEGSRTIVNELGQPLMRCFSCGESWHSETIKLPLGTGLIRESKGGSCFEWAGQVGFEE